MNEGPSRPGIECPIGLFGQVECEIEDITQAINRAPSAVEKASLAGALRAAVATLLDCNAYDENNTNCRLCREFSTLRDKTAAAIEQAARLAR